jgi:hypothetical protein
MIVNIVEGAVDGVQGLVHAGLHLIPVLGPILAKIVGLVL